MAMFDYWHNNPPAPLNPEYKPYARIAQTIAVKQLEEEGFYEKYTREERVASGEITKRYELICKEFEEGKRSL